jgi:hypothetical protein
MIEWKGLWFRLPLGVKLSAFLDAGPYKHRRQEE